MRLARCEKGHLYDKSRDARCPLCAEIREVDEATSFRRDAPSPFMPRAASDFMFMERLGKGVSGSVYRVQLTQEFAMKEISWQDGGREKARREYETGRAFLGHPHIIAYLDYYEEDEKSYILQELAQPLEKWYRQMRGDGQRLTVRETLRMGLQVCDALEAIREKGLLHYDVKPGNLFFCNGQVKIGDFSHCVPCREGKPYTAMIGTYEFAAPEIVNGGLCSGREDVYSFGVCLYMMLSGGRHPFDFACRKPAVRQRGDSVRPLGIASARLSRFFDQALAYDSSERFGDMKEAARFLESVLNARSGMADQTTVPFYAPELTLDTETLPPFSQGTDSWKEPVYTSAAFHSHSMGDSAADWAGDAPSQPFRTEQSQGRSIDCQPTFDDWGLEGDTAQQYAAPMDDAGPFDGGPHPSCPSAPDPQPAPAPAVDEVLFSVVAEKAVGRDESRLVEIAMYEEAMRQRVMDEIKSEFDGQTLEKSSHPIWAEQGAQVTVMLFADGITIEENQITYCWRGKYLRFSFEYYVPEDYSRRQISFKAIVYINDVIATTLRFIVNVSQEQQQDAVPCFRSDVRSAFLSYSRDDIEAVTYMLQAIKRARPDLDVFFDVETLRTGERWEERLYSEILKRDKLFLCWSSAAARSIWVEREWRCMVNGKGLDAVEPIPLESPERCPPPPPLDELHFDAMEIMIRNSKRFIRMNDTRR